MRATADISWPGGKAQVGDAVDTDAIPPLTLSRWIETGVLVPADQYVEPAAEETE